MFDDFRSSINNLIRIDKPESPTDVVFIFVSLALVAMQVYALLTRTVVPGFDTMLVFVTTIKGVKVLGDYQKAKADEPPAAPANVVVVAKEAINVTAGPGTN